jgi:hypothetical protein
MKPIAKRWPDNVEVFHIADLPVDTLDQGMMRLLRKIANEKGWTVEKVIVAAIKQRVAAIKQRVERYQAGKNLDGKIIRFPETKYTPTKSDPQRSSRRRSVRPFRITK